MRGNRSSFTLVEIAASLVILGVALVSILGMFYVGSKASRLSEERTIAYNLLQRKMEEVISKIFADIAGASDETYPDFPNYTLDTSVTDLSATMKEITVSIRWPSATGGTNQETITTKLTNIDRALGTKTSGKKEGWSWGNRPSKTK